MARVLVTGGAGYIGSHTAKALTAAGHRVVVLDDLSAGHIEATRGLPLVQARVHDTAAVRAALAEHAIDAVMHFAAWLAVGESVRHPGKYYENNLTGSIHLLEAMAAEGVGRIVFSSTCAIYGEPQVLPLSEDHPKAPVNAYGESKLAVERALRHFETAHDLKSIALRYFNAAGADPEGELGEDHDPEIHLIPLAIAAARGGRELKVFGQDYPTPDGTCLRDYVHVADLAEAHVKALAALEAGAASTQYNVGTGRPWSVKEVIDTVGRVVGTPVRWSPAPRRDGDPSALYAASARTEAGLGWRPRMSDLETIVTHAAAWHAAHPEGYRSAQSR
ncbi:MAG: UDP-glucose 4-epimerase GalE [Acidobacteria bacterium]|nr:UDP-glucose 4-epimerase GalE [Acidobacteriota bacterium]